MAHFQKINTKKPVFSRREIKGMLQENLERLYKEYVWNTIGADIYYDPKDMRKADIPRNYYQCVRFGKKHCPHLIKNGWEAFR